MEAFVNCIKLKTLIIEDGVEIIDELSFYGCTGLTSITIPNSVTSIGPEAFEECTSLQNVYLGNSVTSIGFAAFEGCTGLTSITIPNSVTSIGDGAFSNCTSLTSIAIPYSVTSIGSEILDDCNITNLILGRADYDGGSLGQCFAEGASMIITGGTIISDYLFFGCTGLTSVTIPNSVTSIGQSAFRRMYRINKRNDTKQCNKYWSLCI